MLLAPFFMIINARQTQLISVKSSLLFLLCFSVLSAMAAEHNVVGQEQIDLLQLGMPQGKVEAIIGAPQTKLTRGLVSRWDYAFGSSELTVWFGERGLRNAYGDAFSTFHLVNPPEGYQAPVAYDVEADPNRHVEVKQKKEQFVSEDDSIFTPILPQQDILNSLEQWRLARESRNVRRYAANYSADYSSKKHLNHKQWLDEVSKSMAKARFIKVSVEQVNTQFVHSRKVLVSFVQKYQSNRYSDKVKKQLQYEYIASQWLITKEKTLAKL